MSSKKELQNILLNSVTFITQLDTKRDYLLTARIRCNVTNATEVELNAILSAHHCLCRYLEISNLLLLTASLSSYLFPYLVPSASVFLFLSSSTCPNIIAIGQGVNSGLEDVYTLYNELHANDNNLEKGRPKDHQLI